MLAFFEVSLQVHGEQRGAGRIVRAANWPVVATDLMLSAGVTDGNGEAETTWCCATLCADSLSGVLTCVLTV